jgi:hypothetical protein
MPPPVPRAWIGLAFFAAFAGTFLISLLLPDVVDRLAGELPRGAATPVLTLILMLVGVAIQASWWGLAQARARHQGPSPRDQA